VIAAAIMKITLLGHASVLVELDGGATCLMDPVLRDPFEEGAVTSCPRRTVHAERLPPIDLLIVSHRHPDHFDLPSLAALPRDCDAICPADPLIAYALKQLGFQRIHAVHPMGPIWSPDFDLYPTQSESPGVPELGMVFHDRSGTFWNQVDSSLSTETIAKVAERFGRIDLLFAMYASQNFDFFESRATDFPFQEHRQNLQNVLRIQPRLVAPGSAGFRFCGEHAWLNAFLFPISAERFVADLARLDPSLATAVMMPGDVFEIAPAGVLHRRAASAIAVTDEDDRAQIRFDPTAPIPVLRDANPDGYPMEQLAAVTEPFVRDGLGRFLDGDHPLVLRHRALAARYAVEVVFPDGSAVFYRFDLGRVPVRAEPSGEADAVHRIAASALVGWAERKRSFFSVRVDSRRFSTLYELARVGADVRVEPQLLPDLLMYYLLHVAPGAELAAKQRIDWELHHAS
jgi:L-ascorbate metabolism protein UlaG (beta-lactamase superfamily)